MPHPPGRSPAADALRGSPYSTLLAKMATHRGEIYPLHVGDTWKEAPEGGRPEELGRGIPGINRYTDVWGLPELREAIAARAAARTGTSVARGNVLVTGGATAGLMASIGALVSPGEEILLLAPRWPLVEGHVRMAGATPVEVPLLLGGHSGDLSPESAVAAVEAHATERTVGLYLNTPNNPSGRLIPRASLAALGACAQRRDLWIFADEVYEDYAYAGPHAYAFPFAPERTVAAHSLSKAYGLAGARLGWLVGPEAALSQIVKFGAHTIYSAPTASQHAALRILAGAGDAWVAEARTEYAATGREAARRLGMPAPEGGTFLFLDVADALDERGLMGLLEDVAGEGLFLAPGPSFGPYPTHVRLCYTAVPPDVALRGVDVLARRL
ncbi:MAG: pyridoxal phosphate-dependent aminotransferase [Thermoanaerobaculia bacterium]|nr:pyridoxal phosphate-dependent aminotransferase [Thermoanaerobaculia bacterium]